MSTTTTQKEEDHTPNPRGVVSSDFKYLRLIEGTMKRNVEVHIWKEGLIPSETDNSQHHRGTGRKPRRRRDRGRPLRSSLAK